MCDGSRQRKRAYPFRTGVALYVTRNATHIEVLELEHRDSGYLDLDFAPRRTDEYQRSSFRERHRGKLSGTELGHLGSHRRKEFLI